MLCSHDYHAMSSKVYVCSMGTSSESFAEVVVLGKGNRGSEGTMWGFGKHQATNDASRSNEHTRRKTTSVVVSSTLNRIGL